MSHHGIGISSGWLSLQAFCKSNPSCDETKFEQLLETVREIARSDAAYNWNILRRTDLTKTELKYKRRLIWLVTGPPKFTKTNTKSKSVIVDSGKAERKSTDRVSPKAASPVVHRKAPSLLWKHYQTKAKTRARPELTVQPRTVGQSASS